ncbi:MAG: amidohydrolase family protein [Wenzhouxiangella sp.]
MRVVLFSLALSALLATAANEARSEVTAFVGARVITVAGPEIDDGVLLIEGRTIRAVGERDAVRIPRGAKMIELESGTVIMPGLVDTHSHIGEIDLGDRSSPIQAGVRVMDSINVRSSGMKRALAGGITTANVMPGSGHLVSGQTAYLKLRSANTIDGLLIESATGLSGGLKMANGTNPLSAPPFPTSRAKSAALVRQEFIRATEYRDKRNGNGDTARDLGLETLVEVLDGKRLVHFHSHRHDDLITAIRLRDEFGFRMVLHHTSEAWRVAEEIAAAQVPVSLIVVDSPGGKLESLHLEAQSAPALEAAQAKVAFHTDDWITDSRYFLRMAAMGVRAGMSRGAALEAMTIRGAEMMDLGERIGTLEPGKDADFVILSGDPFSIYSRILQTWVEGDKRFDLDDPDDRLVAEGGFNALTDDDALGHAHHGDRQ